MNKRDMIKLLGVAWTAPIVTAVSLPAHAQTSEVVIHKDPPSDDPEEECIDCDDDNPPHDDDDKGMCKGKEHKTPICHHPRNGNNQSICVGNPSVKKHIKLHGDTIGQCD